MILITGIDRNRILDAFTTTDVVNSRLSGDGVRKVEHYYTHKFLCQSAKINDDNVTLETYFEMNDAICIRKKADIEGLEINVSVREQA